MPGQKLKYNGEQLDGQNDNPYILMVPSCDMNYGQIVNVAKQKEMEPDDLIALLIDGAPGRCTLDGRPLYEIDEPEEE